MEFDGKPQKFSHLEFQTFYSFAPSLTRWQAETSTKPVGFKIESSGSVDA